MPETHELPLDVIRKAWDENVKPGAEGDSTGSPWAGVAYLGNEERAVKFARAIVTAARQSDEAARIAAQREAASRAWQARHQWGCGAFGSRTVENAMARDEYLDREHPLPARECVLSNGDRVTLSDCKHYLIVRNMAEPPRTWRVDQWRHIAITGADFDALKSFAAGVGR